MPLSYSQIQTYRRCPKQYEFAYVKKIGRAMTTGESFGSSIHNTLKRWGELEMQLQEHKNPTAKQLTLFMEQTPVHPVSLDLPLLLGFWENCFISETYPNRAEADDAYKAGRMTLERFYEWWSSCDRHVVGIEKSFKVEIFPHAEGKHHPDDITVLSGRLDRVERTKDGLIVIDFKSSNVRPQEEVDADLQLSIYAKAVRELWDEPAVSLSLLFVNEREIVERKTTRSPDQLRNATITIQEVAEHIEKDDFQATPSVEKCRKCPYRSICPDCTG